MENNNNNKYLLKDMIMAFNRISFLEDDYKKHGIDRLLIRKTILKNLKEYQ